LQKNKFFENCLATRVVELSVGAQVDGCLGSPILT
jgi:hypothetical protein